MSYTQVFKAVVTNDIEATIVDNSYNTRELVVYSTKGDLKTGERYRIFYETVAHPLQGQKAVGLIHKIEKSDIDLEKFQVTPQVLESLKCFQVQDGESVEAKMNENFERFKDIAGAETQKMIQLAVDLFYHTPLKFRFGRRVERAYLEPFILGETRTSKSQTAKKALETYQLGVFTSLKTATATALIGGLDKTLGKVKLGVLPRNHKGAVIFEEFSDAGKEYIKQLTDIRSSNMVRIHRVAGEVTAEAMVRMLTISNQAKTDGGSNRDLDNYPHGVKAVVELVGAIEDIARYDFFVMIESPKDGYTSPLADFDLEYEAYPTESYRNRVRWIWSRTEDQVKITREVAEYIVAKAEELNKNFDCHIKFFGPEAWKKLARIAIATASCVCSIDETGENLVVTNDHVDWAYNFLLQCYDNNTFKLREYVEERRRYTECDDLAINRLQGLYNQHSVVIDQLAMSTEMSQTQLRNISNMSMEDFSSFLNAMAKLYFFEYTSREKITPTPRFRKALNQIKNQYVSKVGEGGR